MTIDRTSAEPYYLQLGRYLNAQIASGHYALGDRLPSESALCRQFELSRSTVRETFRMMESDGRIRLVQRRGAFVCAERHPGWMVQFAGGFSESEAAHENRSIHTKVLGLKKAVLPDEACAALRLPVGSRGVILERLRWVDGQLALFARNHLRMDLARALGDGERLNGRASLNKTLAAAGVVELGARRSLSATASTPALARHLEVPEGYPLMLVQSVTWDVDQQPYDYYTSWLNSEVIDVSIEVQVAGGGSKPVSR